MGPMGNEMMSHAFPFGTVMLVLAGVAVVGFGWWRVNDDPVATRATALHSVAFVGLFLALAAGFVLVRSVVADATDAAPGHEAMMSQMAGMMSGDMMDGYDGQDGGGMMPGIPDGGGYGGMMPGTSGQGGYGGMMPDVPSGHPPIDGIPSGSMMPGVQVPSASPSPEVTTFVVTAAGSSTPYPSTTPIPDPSPSASLPPGHPGVPGGMMPGVPSGGGYEGMMPGLPGGMMDGGQIGSPAMHEQLAAGHERMQRQDATTAALFLIAGLIAWSLALSSARKLGERPEATSYRGLVFAGSALTLLYGSVVAVDGFLHAIAPGMYVDSFLEDLQRRGGMVDLLAGVVLAVASALLLRSVRGPQAVSEPGPAE